ncbi:hypothetical protein FPV67DRAFT_1544298 [Lyophyllum atratum]|nr:hypothetical protein FPV67DRAFT_1544298 [Lyophyllum atratum]
MHSCRLLQRPPILLRQLSSISHQHLQILKSNASLIAEVASHIKDSRDASPQQDSRNMNPSIAVLATLAAAAAAANVVPPQVGPVDFQDTICLKACFPAKPLCPAGYDARRFGGCWDCCKDPALP